MISISGATFFSLLCIVLILSVVPVGAQESDGIPPGTPARASNPDNPSSPPDTIIVASEGCDQVEEGATVTLEDGDAAQPTQVRLVDGTQDIEITEADGRIEIKGPPDEDIYQQGVFLDPSDTSFDDADGVTAVVTSTGITGCAQTTGTARDPDGVAPADDDGADGSARADDDGADDRQYADDRKVDVIIKTVPDKPLPKTGGSPLLLGAGLMLLAATVLGSRVIGRR